jgi:hypothetical protein
VGKAHARDKQAASIVIPLRIAAAHSPVSALAQEEQSHAAKLGFGTLILHPRSTRILESNRPAAERRCALESWSRKQRDDLLWISDLFLA